MTIRVELGGAIRSPRSWRLSVGVLATLVLLTGWLASSAWAVDDRVITTTDGSKIECSESGQYCLCSGGKTSQACQKVLTNCAPGSEPDCEGHWCGCNVAPDSPILSGAAKIGGTTKAPAAAKKLVDRLQRKR